MGDPIKRYSMDETGVPIPRWPFAKAGSAAKALTRNLRPNLVSEPSFSLHQRIRFILWLLLIDRCNPLWRLGLLWDRFLSWSFYFNNAKTLIIFARCLLSTLIC